MRTIEVIKRFIESNWIIDKAVRDVLERMPARFRYGISYGPTFRYWLGFLKESEKWDRDTLDAYQVEQLKVLLIHSGKNIPYYKRIFKEYGFDPERLQSLDDISMLPYLDKAILKRHYREFIAENIPRSGLISAATSGTTGIPLIIYGTKETEEKHWATIVDLWSRIGYGSRSRTIFFDPNIGKGEKGCIPYKKYGNKMILSSNCFAGRWVAGYEEMIDKFRPEYLVGFPHTLATFASLMRDRGSLPFNGLKGVIAYAENIYEWQREIINEVFGVSVFADYGMVEKVVHGGSCEHSSEYHIYPQYGYTEYLPAPGSKSELVGTGFINYAMPLIRYRNGDVCKAGAGSCFACRRNYDVLDTVEGRSGDFLVNSEGQIISVYLNADFRILNGIERFQLYQDSPGEVELLIWPKEESIKEETLNEVASEIKRGIGAHDGRIIFRVTTMEDRQTHSPAKYRMIDQRLDIRNFL